MTDHLPEVHLRPAAGWTNDPTGPLRWHGRVHLFHQHNAAGGYWDRPSWGHLVSDDLVRWSRRPAAIDPQPDGPDRDGCFSGCVVVDGDQAVLAYTGVEGPVGPGQVQATCLARSRDPWLDVWDRDPANPVTAAPDEPELLGFRDPFLWREDGRWWQLVGAGTAARGGEVRLFTSADLRRWEPHGTALSSEQLHGVDPAVWTGSMWECPVLLRGRGGDALLLSIHDEVTTHYPLAVVGTWQAPHFLPRGLHRLDLGPDLYAPCLLPEPDGTATSWGWCWEARTPEAQRAAGWAGMLSAPRQLSISGDRLTVAPHPAIAELRRDELAVRAVATDRGWQVADLPVVVADLELELDPGVARVQLWLRRSPDDDEVTVLELDRAGRALWLDRERSSLDEAARGGRYGGPLPADLPYRRVRVLLDRSSVEVFVDDQVALTARIYPTRPDSTGIEVVGHPDQVAGVRLRAWELGSIWTEEDRP